MTTYKINKNLIIQKLDDKTVMFDSDKSVLYTLNETANYILSQLKKKVPEDEMVKKMVKRYGVKAEKVKKDIKETINDLKKKKIVYSSPSQS